MEVLFILIGGLGLVFLLGWYLLFSYSFVAMKFYGWFVLPFFPNLPHFTVNHFIGFGLFLGVLIRSGSGGYKIKDEYRDKNTEHFNMIVLPWVSLLIGYIFHTFFM